MKAANKSLQATRDGRSSSAIAVHAGWSRVPELWTLGDFDTFMKTRRLVTLFALLGALIASGISASADEHPGSGTTGLGGTTVGGSVGSTTGGQFHQPAQPSHEGWWLAFCHWFRFCDR